jgi:hypothetical protein
MMNAARMVAEEAKSIAGKFSTRIPAATRVSASGDRIQVITYGDEAPNAAPFDFPIRHPLNYPNQRDAKLGKGRRYFARTPHRPYMEVAATRKIDAAAEEVADVLDDWAKKAGFND